MPTRGRRAAAVVAASLAFLCGASILFWIAGFLSFLVVDRWSAGSGGIGAVSAGVSEFVVIVLLAVPGPVVINGLLRRWARSSAGPARRLHRAHSLTLLSFFALAALGFALSARAYEAGEGSVIFNVFLVFLAVWVLYAAQFLLLGVVLVLYARSYCGRRAGAE